MRRLAGVIFVFIAFFRPAILHPSLPSTLFILPFVFAPLLRSPSNFFRPVLALGPASFVLIFILVWSLTVDLFIDGFSTMRLRSQFATAIRFLLYIYIAYYIVNFLTSDRSELRRTILWAIGVQCIIAIAMFLDQRIKFFFFKVLSGYTGGEKVFREHFLGVRVFGWSEELFYLAPVMMLSSVILFYRSRYIKWLATTIFVGIVAALNARVSALATLLLFSQARGVATILTVFLAITFGGGVLSSFSEGAGRISEISSYVFSDFEGGESETVNILLGHLHFPETSLEWVFGSHTYFYGDAAPVKSDVGFVIALMFGGAVYLAAWIFVIGWIIHGCSSSFFFKSLLAAVFVGLGIKGLIFSGNAMTLLILIMYFARQRKWGNMA